MRFDLTPHQVAFKTEVEAFKEYMSSEVVQAQDTFLALHPELEILRDSRTNRLYRELRIVS